jgi:hypothetical protein
MVPCALAAWDAFVFILKNPEGKKENPSGKKGLCCYPNNP